MTRSNSLPRATISHVLARRGASCLIAMTLVIASAFSGTHGSAFAQLSKPTALLKGEVRSDEDQRVVSGLQIYVTKGTDRVATAKTNTEGKFTAIVPPGAQYRIDYVSSDYAYREDTIDIAAADKFQEVPVRATLTPLRDKQDFTPKQAVFKRGSAEIEGAAADRLDQLSTLVRKNSRVHLEIDVYPDYEIHSKKDAAEAKLMNARAAALRTFFLSRNVTPSMVSVATRETMAGSGQQQVSVTETSAKGKKKSSKAASKSAIAEVVRITGRLS